jgi:hypothetical protein
MISTVAAVPAGVGGAAGSGAASGAVALDGRLEDMVLIVKSF